PRRLPERAHSIWNQREGRARSALDVFGKLTLFGFLFAIGGCDAGDPAPQPVDAPALELVGVSAVTALDEGTPVRAELSRDGTTRVLSTTDFRLRFNRFLLPSSVTRQSICLRSATGVVASYDECIGAEFLEP